VGDQEQYHMIVLLLWGDRDIEDPEDGEVIIADTSD
jgi:hypothetical protein